METTIPSIQTKALADNAPWYKHRWPWLLMFGPAMVVLAGSYTGYIAFTRQDALVVGDYYKQGKAINQDLRRDRVASSLGIRSELSYQPDSGQLVGSVENFRGPQAGVVMVSLLHSTLPSKDIRVPAQLDSNGRFAIKLPMLDMARWQVLLEDQQRTWRVEGVWNWPKEHGVNISADIQSAD